MSLMLDLIQFTLIHGISILGSYAILFFTALDFTFTTRHIHHWTSFLLWPTCFIFSRAVSNHPLFFPSSILDTFQSGGLIWCHIFMLFHTVQGFLQAKKLQWVAISSSSGPCFVRTLHYHLSWVTLHGMAHSFTELCKSLHHDKDVFHKGEI